MQTDDEVSSHPLHGDVALDWDLTEMKGSVGVVSVAVVALAAGYEFLAYLLFAVALYIARAVKPAPDKSDIATLVSGLSFLHA